VCREVAVTAALPRISPCSILQRGDDGIYDHTISYDTQSRRTLVENSLGEVTLYQLNEFGQVISSGRD